MAKCFKECSDPLNPCGARWCEFCTILTDTESGCCFRKIDIPNVAEEILELYESGESIQNVRNITKEGRETTNWIIKTAIDRGLVTKHTKCRTPKEILTKARELRLKGYNNAEVARRVGCVKSTVRDWIAKGYI